jgi:hypothetical protein
MNGAELDIPDDPVAVASWLENSLVGRDLISLAGQLKLVHGSEAPLPTLDEILADSRDSVLQRGLANLPPEKLWLLLAHPARLLELQRLVLIEGGAYWQHLLESDPALLAKAQHDRPLIAKRLSSGRAPAPLAARKVRPWLRPRLAWSIAAAAAAIFLALLTLYPKSPLSWSRWWPAKDTEAVWGWDRVGMPDRSVSGSAYLARLADAAEEWFNKRTENGPALTLRIIEMRKACLRLAAAEHAPLKQEDRRWLRDKCHDWTKKFDESLADLEAGKPVEEVRLDMDNTVRKLATTLRNHAASLGKGKS